MKYDYQDIKILREKAERETKNIDIGKHKKNTNYKNMESNREDIHMQSCENTAQNDKRSGQLMTLAICLCMIAAAGVWIMNASRRSTLRAGLFMICAVNSMKVRQSKVSELRFGKLRSYLQYHKTIFADGNIRTFI